MICTAERYDWFRKQYAQLSGSYCLTLVADLTPHEAIHRVGGRNPELVPGPLVVRGLPADVVARLPDELGPIFDRFEHEHVVAVTEMAGWLLMVESSGRFLGLGGAVPLSAGTTLVAHGVDETGPHFLWMHDGQVQLAFDPERPGVRTGVKADAMLQVMAEVGFVLGNREDRTGKPGMPYDPAHALAFADFLTGVRFDPATLHEAVYLCAGVDDGDQARSA